MHTLENNIYFVLLKMNVYSYGNNIEIYAKYFTKCINNLSN